MQAKMQNKKEELNIVYVELFLYISPRVTQVFDEGQSLPGYHDSTSIIHGALANIPAIQMTAQ